MNKKELSFLSWQSLPQLKGIRKQIIKNTETFVEWYPERGAKSNSLYNPNSSMYNLNREIRNAKKEIKGIKPR